VNELTAGVFIYVPTGDPIVDAKNRLLIAEHGYCFPQKIVVGTVGDDD
jgi:hypothetical protein